MKLLSFLLAGTFALMCYTGLSQTLPAGFTTTTIGSGWNLPLGTAFTNDGQKMFVWEKDGRVYVCNRNATGGYVKQTTPVLDISEEVANWGDHGLMGFALDPNYSTNGLIYLLYVVDRHYLMNFGTPAYNPATSSTGATIGRITRYKTTTSGSNTAADLSTRFILLGETRQTGICIMHDSHGLGTLAFASDGTLLATAGDGGSYYLVDKGSDTDTDFQQALADGIIRPAENVGAFRAQLLNSHNGKLLRIDPVTGNGVSSNPYYTAAQPRSPKSRVWAFGLRNPFRFSIKAGTGSTNPAAGDVGEIFVGDVGWNTYEEVTVISTPGVNCGWPLFEGLTAQPGYTSAVTANLDEPNPLFGIGGCTKQYFNFQDLIKQVTADNNKTVFNSCNPATPIGTGNRFVHHRPSIDWRHFTNEARVGIFSGNTASTAMIGSPESNVIGTPFPGNCALGGPWYTGTNFPAAYQNKYFVGDHDGKWIRCFSVDFTDVVTEVKNFGTGFLGTVNINMNPLDGTLVVVELGNFSTIGPAIKQIRFGGNQAPIVRMTSDKTFGPSVLNVNFTGNTSSDPDGTIASYAWNFGDGGTSTSTNPSHNFTAPANTPTKYVVRLTVTDNLGASSVDSIIISVNNTPPVVNITSPVKNSLYKIGPDTVYTCSATVTDAQHSGAQLKYEWQTFLRHNSHQHPEPISNDISPTTHISRIGCTGDDYYWLIQLTVTDAAGLSATDSSKIFPDCSPGVDNIPPSVSSVTPVNGATNITTGTTVSAIFNETIDPVTVTGTTFQLKDAANNVVPGSITTSFNQVTFTPSAALAGSSVYTATIKSGASGVKDLAGNALVIDYSWTFTTIDVDLTPPTITSVVPVNGTTGVSSGSTLTANFNEALDGASVNGTTFQLRDAANNLVPGTISATAGQITLTPSASLTGLTSYTATLIGGPSGIKDLAGNALATDYVWSFTTDAVDDIPPTVISVMPASAALGVGVSASVSANLSEAINVSTVTSATFELKDHQNNLIAATVSSLSGVLTLTPVSALATSTTYTATITGGASGVKDLAGNALASNYSWSFTTVGGTIAPPVTIQSFDSKSLIGSTTHSLTAVPAGALLVLSTTADAFVSDCSVSSIPALTWTKRVDAAAPSSDNAEIWTAVYATGGSITITSDWGEEYSQASVCYVLINAEPVLNGVFGTAVLQPAPSVTVTTTRENSIIFGCTADWKAINGATRTLRDAAIERLYFKDGHFTTYHYTKAAATITAYTEGVSFPSTQQASTSLLEIRSDVSAASIPPTVTTHPSSQNVCPGANVSFTSNASGDTPTVQWQSSIDGTIWSDINGAVNSVLTFAATTSDNNTQYRAVWTNTGGPASSNPATLTVNIISAPAISVTNNCGSSELTVVSFGGSLLWSNGAATPSITVTTAGTYSVTQTVNGCISAPGSAVATPKAIPFEPSVAVADNCGNSVLTASGFSGSLLWSTGETTESITVNTAGTYTVTQTVDGCASTFGSATAAPKDDNIEAPIVTVVNDCGNSILTASGYTGTLLWSTGETTPTITVAASGTYTATQTANGCSSSAGSGSANPLALPPTPTISVVNNCENSLLTASGFAGSLLWSTGETTSAITITSAGTYTLTQTVDACTSEAGIATATPKSIPQAPGVIVVDNCGNSVLTASGHTGLLLWNTGETTESITVTIGGTYTVTQTVDGCTSIFGSGVASPLISAGDPPLVSVVNNCGHSVLTASGYTGSLLWSTGQITESITVHTAGTYTVTQTVNGCISPAGSGTAVPNPLPSTPIVSVVNNCESALLTASGFTGSLLWSTGETTASIDVTVGGTYTVTQTMDGCVSNAGSGIAAPNAIPSAPGVIVIDNCGSSVLTATGYAGSLLWSTGETTESITVTVGGTYTVTQTVNGCTSTEGSGVTAPKSIPIAPTVTVVDNCGNSVLTATAFSGSLLWSTGETAESITVSIAGTYTVTQSINGCASPEGSGAAAPNIPSVPTVSVADNCEYTVLTASGFAGSILWSTGETTESITVATAGTYTVTQSINGCASLEGSGIAVPKTIPVAPVVTVVDNCGNSVLTASAFTGSLLWSTGESTESITVIGGGTYTVTQTINGCTSPSGSGIAAPNAVPSSPIVTVIDDCGNSLITAYDFTGSLLWSTGETTASISVTAAGTYSVTQSINGCTSPEGSGIAAPHVIPSAPLVSVADNCEYSVLTASGFTGALLWSTGETISSITVTTGGTYTVTQTINGCTSVEGSGIAAPNTIPVAPAVSVVDNCGISVLTASGHTGSLLWSTGETTESITVTAAETYTVSQKVNGCASSEGSGVAAPQAVPSAPIVTVIDDCSNSILTAYDYTGSLLWSTGETTASITVSTGGTYTVTQTVNGCASPQASGLAAPHVIPSAPIVSVVNNCQSSVLTASGPTGSLLWSTGETTASITVATAGAYTVTQTTNGCTSVEGSGIAAPKTIPVAPVVTVIDNCGNSILTASGYTGSLLWSVGATTASITVMAPASYTVTQTVNGCTSVAGTGPASPKPIPVLSGNLATTSVSGTAFTYTPGSTIAGTNFAWSRAAVAGVSNTAASGTGNINETLINTLSTPVNVTYVYTLTANGCTNTQNVVVTVSSVPVVTSVSPANGAVGVSTSPTITANFSEALNGATVTAATFQLKDAANNVVPATISTSSNIISLLPTAALANSTTYTVTIKGGASGVRGLAGNALLNDYTWSFTTLASQPPLTIQSSNTQTGTTATVHPLTGVPAGALLVLTTTADAVVSNCVVSSSPSLTWTKRVDAGAPSSDNAEIWTAVYAAGGSITVTSNWGSENSQASVCHVVLNAEPTLSGAFGTAVLQPAPSVTVTTTRENSIIFGCTADWKAVNGATRTLRDAATERLYFKDGNYTTYHYTKAATSIAAYTEGVSLPTGQQASTALLEIRSATVTIDNTPPAVTSVTPVNGTTGIAVNSTASAVFNEAMNAATINNSTIELRNSSNTLIATTVSFNAATRTATLTPTAPLANSTVYTITIKGAASGVKDVAGNALVNDFIWSFTTEVADIIPPTVTVVSPLNGATGVTSGANIIANFSEAVNAATVTTTTFQLRDAGNNLIPASVSTSSGQITLDPTSALTASTVYTATITGGASGVKDLAGNALATNYSWSFTTAAVTSQPVTIQSVNTKTGIAATVHPLTGVPAGALLVLATTADAVVSDCSVSSSPALTWTKRVDAGAPSSDNAEIWTAVYAAGGSISVTSNWGFDNSQSSVCYVVLNAEPTLGGTFGTAVLQPAPSVTVTTTRENSIIFGCTADWKAINGATRTLRDAATERLYFKDGNYTTYHYTKATTSIGSYTEGISFPTGQQASTALLEIRSAGSVATRPVSALITGTTNSNPDVKAHSLGQNYPNPFENETNIPFALWRAEKVTLTVFDVSGRTVKVLVNASKEAGKHTVSFNPGSLSKGVYFYRIQAGDFTDVKKLIIW